MPDTVVRNAVRIFLIASATLLALAGGIVASIAAVVTVVGFEQAVKEGRAGRGRPLTEMLSKTTCILLTAGLAVGLMTGGVYPLLVILVCLLWHSAGLCLTFKHLLAKKSEEAEPKVEDIGIGEEPLAAPRYRVTFDRIKNGVPAKKDKSALSARRYKPDSAGVNPPEPGFGCER